MSKDNSHFPRGIFFNGRLDSQPDFVIGQLNIADREEFIKWVMEQPTTSKGGVPIQITENFRKEDGKKFTSMRLDKYALDWDRKQSEKRGGNTSGGANAPQMDDSGILPF